MIKIQLYRPGELQFALSHSMDVRDIKYHMKVIAKYYYPLFLLSPSRSTVVAYRAGKAGSLPPWLPKT